MTQQRFNVGDKVVYTDPFNTYTRQFKGLVGEVTSTLTHDGELHLTVQFGEAGHTQPNIITAAAHRFSPAAPAEFVIFDYNSRCYGKLPTVETAISHAESLAKESPGLLFTVVQAVAHVKAEQPTVTVTRL